MIRSHARLALAAALALSCGCSDSSTTTAQTEFPADAATATAMGSPLVELLAAGPEAVAHAGIRQVEIHEKASGGSSVATVYREAVAVGAEGEYSLVPIESVAPANVDEDLFLALQSSHSGFNFRYRDFRVRDLAAFQANYSLTVAGATLEHLGRACVPVEVDDRSGQGVDYDLLVDAQTGLVLASQAVDAASGALLQRMTYLDVEFGEPTAFEPDQGTNAEQPVDVGQPLAAQVGFEPMLPTYLPEGFVMSSASTVVDPLGATWFMLVCTDGVEPLFLLERAPFGGGATTFGAPPLEKQAFEDLGSIGGSGLDANSELIGYRAGRVRVLQGTLADVERIAVGSRPIVELQLTLESTLP